MLKPKTDIKGFDFVKSTTSKESEAFYRHILDKYIMGDDIDVRGMLNELQEYSKMVKESIERGEVKYLPNVNAKDISSYKNPSSVQAVLGMITWNYLNPDKEIDIPSKPKLIKLSIFNESDLELIKDDYPFEYATLKEKIFHDTTGIFTTTKDVVKKNGYVEKKVKSKGCCVMCIPSNETIPEWCKPYIDYSTIINNILSSFKGVAEIFGVRNISVGKTVNGTARKSEKITNIVKF